VIRRLAFVAIVVIAIGFIHRKRRRKQTAETIAPTARPTSGTTTVGVVAEVPGYEATTMHLRPTTAPTARRDEPEKS
jgi:hypothetical protein